MPRGLKSTSSVPSGAARDSLVVVERAHEHAIIDRVTPTGVRQLVQDSWQRSLSLSLDPARPAREETMPDAQLRSLRNRHPLAAVLPVVHDLLIRHVFDAGLLVAVGDESGRLLWIDGDRSLRREVEAMLFVEGANWSESHVGTSAPGTALALDRGIQIRRAEHFNALAHPWSCTAVPIHDPHTGAILGVIDITGGDEAVAPHTLPLVEAAVAKIEAELRLHRLDATHTHARTGTAEPQPIRSTVRRSTVRTPVPLGLNILGSDYGRLDGDNTTLQVSPRHAEILTLLAWHREGLSADRLADLLSDTSGAGPASVDTLRAEMVRVRRALDAVRPAVKIGSRPYRLLTPVALDAQGVLALLQRGAHRVAFAAYRGAVLPTSRAPGIIDIRTEVSTRLREAMLTDASIDVLWEYAHSDEATYDSEVWRACLQLLPARSAKRATVVARLQWIDTELGAGAGH